MTLFSIDSATCIGDGACVAECPSRLITLGTDGIPTSIEGAEALCINCGHCTAVCPMGALELTTMPIEQCTALNRELLPSAEQVAELLHSRRSIRAYQDKTVDRAIIEQALDVVRYAPSAHNDQDIEWLVLSNRQTVHQLASMTIDYLRHLQEKKPAMGAAVHADRLIAVWEAGIDRICRGAPHVMIAHGPKGSRWGPINTATALANLDFAALSLGLGTCWLGYVMAAEAHWAPIKELLDLPAERTVYGVVALGYPAYEYQRIPTRKPARIIWR